MKRWLLLPVGIAMALGALWVLTRPMQGPPLGRIDAESRAQLEQVLREADREGGRR